MIPHEATPRTARACSMMTRIVRAGSRLAVTARARPRRARASRACRLRLSSKSCAFCTAMPACSAKASSTRWWCAVNAAGRVEKAEMTPSRPPPTRSGTHSIERMPSRSSTSRRAERGSARTSSDADRPSRSAHAPDDALADRQRERAPLVALEAVGGGVDEPRRARGRGARCRSRWSRSAPVTERLIRSSTEATSRRAVMSWLVRRARPAPRPGAGSRRAGAAARCAEASGRASSASDLHVGVVEGARARRAASVTAPNTPPPAHERHQQRRAEARARRGRCRLTSGTVGAVDVVDRAPARRSATTCGQQRALAAACARRAARRAAAERASTSTTSNSRRSASSSTDGQRVEGAPAAPARPRRRAARRRGVAGDEQRG